MIASLRGRLVASMTMLLLGGLALVSGLHALEAGGHDLGGRLSRLLLGDELPEPWQDLAVLLPFSLVMLGLIGVVTSWSLRPVLRASEQAAAVGPRHPGARIDTDGLPSELRPLVETVNAALDRLAGAFEAERRFTADAAHALRTPLAALSLRLQRGRSEPAGLDWQAMEADLATMRRLVEGLLDLARKEARSGKVGRLNLARIVREAAAGMEPLVQAAGRPLEVALPDQIRVAGDAPDLRDMVRNLIENALLHGSGQIHVALSAAPAKAVLEVADDGDGVPPAARAAMFERFRKGGVASGGSGLGLSIVRAVVQAHGGEACFVDGPGCRVRVVLPLEPP